MRSILSFALALIVMVAVSGKASAQPIAVYDPSTGAIVWEDVADMVGLRINAPGLLVAAQATNLGGATDGAFGVVNDQAPNFIEWGNLLGMTFESQFAGNVFAPGTPFAAIQASGEFLARHSSAPTQNIIVPVQLVPEPSTMLMTGLGMLGLAFRRRRNG